MVKILIATIQVNFVPRPSDLFVAELSTGDLFVAELSTR